MNEEGYKALILGDENRLNRLINNSTISHRLKKECRRFYNMYSKNIHSLYIYPNERGSGVAYKPLDSDSDYHFYNVRDYLKEINTMPYRRYKLKDRRLPA